MKPGQLELLLEYPSCMANAVACHRLHCPFNLGERALVRCGMGVATVSGALEVDEIAAITREEPAEIRRLLRAAMRKLGPQLRLAYASADPTLDLSKKLCRICVKNEVPDIRRLCSDVCRAEARRRSWQAYTVRAASRRPRWKSLTDLADRWLAKLERTA